MTYRRSKSYIDKGDDNDYDSSDSSDSGGYEKWMSK